MHSHSAISDETAFRSSDRSDLLATITIGMDEDWKLLGEGGSVLEEDEAVRVEEELLFAVEDEDWLLRRESDLTWITNSLKRETSSNESLSSTA